MSRIKVLRNLQYLFLVTLCWVTMLSFAQSSSQLVYSTFLNGSNDTSTGNAIAVDLAGNIYVAGGTASPTFPTTSTGYDTSYNGGYYDLYVCKINPSLSGVSSLVYSTYIGGDSYIQGNAIAVDSAGNIYVGGWTDSPNFPVTPNGYDTTFSNEAYDAYICKINPSLSGASSLMYSTYLGTGYAICYALCLDNAGNVYITGDAETLGFPTTPNAYDTIFHFGGPFISEFNTSLSGASSLVYSTFMNMLDGYGYGKGIAVDTAGKIYITGYTGSSTYPVTTNAYNTTFQPDQDVFFSVINPGISGSSALLYSTYLGGAPGDYDENAFGFAIDLSGNAYICGVTRATTFPVTSNAYDTVMCGSEQAFLCKINPTLSGTASLVYSTFLGGDSFDEAMGIAVDTAGNVYLTGNTSSPNFPITSDAFDTIYHHGVAAFVTQMNPSLSGSSSLIYSSFLGGYNNEGGQGIAVDTAGIVYVTGYSNSTNFPVTPNALDTTYRGTGGGSNVAFVSKLILPQVVPVNDWMLYDSVEIEKYFESRLNGR